MNGVRLSDAMLQRAWVWQMLWPSLSSRQLGLDLFRAVAILIVAHKHGQFLMHKAFPGFPYIPIPPGVDLFFALGGFLIGRQLLRFFVQENALNGASFVTFLKRRWLRTLPAYYFILIVQILLVSLGWLNNDLSQFNWKFWVFLQNFSYPFYGFYWESWSLAVQEWATFIFAFSCMIGAFLARTETGRKRIFLFAALFLIFFPMFYRYGLAFQETGLDEFWWGVKIRKTVLTRLDGVGFGFLAAYIRLVYSSVWFRFRWPLFVFGACGLVALTVLPRAYDSYFFKTDYLTLFHFCAVCLLPLADAPLRLGSFLSGGISFVSRLAYSMYLVNLGLGAQIFGMYFKPQTAMECLSAYFAFWIWVFLLSYLLYRFVEEPFSRLRPPRLGQ